MGKSHFFFSPKGGTGTSFSAAAFAQNAKSHSKNVLCFDTDPFNSNLSFYNDLEVTKIDPDIVDTENPRAIDRLLNAMLAAPMGSDIIVDNSSATFLPFCAHLKERNLLEELRDAGYEIYMHTVLVGNASLIETVNGLYALLTNFPKIPIIIWLNETFGEILFKEVHFENTKLFKEFKDQIHGLIYFGKAMPNSFSLDVQKLIENGHTFEEGIRGPHYSLITRQRLAIYWRDLSAKMEAMNL